MKEPVSWVPVVDKTGAVLEGMPLHTFGLAGDHETVPVPEAGGAEVDREVAGLVALLNRAGVRTFQSCQAATDWAEVGPLAAESGEDGEGCYLGPAGLRYGCVVVEWDQYPKLAGLLPRHVGRSRDGWLVTVLRDGGRLFVSVLFPWPDLAEFTASVKAAQPR